MKKLLVIIIAFAFLNFNSQNLTLTAQYGLENSLQNQLLDFQNIQLEAFNFNSVELKGKTPTIYLKEFKKGKHVKTTILLDGISDKKYLTINKDAYFIRFFTEINNEGKYLKTFITNEVMGSAKKKFKLQKNDYAYVLKDFFGAKKELSYSIKDEIPLLAIITPHDQQNGFASYCEVVQSDILPENLGTHFGIPHYFLVMIVFKE